MLLRVRQSYAYGAQADYFGEAGAEGSVTADGGGGRGDGGVDSGTIDGGITQGTAAGGVDATDKNSKSSASPASGHGAHGDAVILLPAAHRRGQT